MKRKVFDLLWVPSLIVCIAISWLWIRSTSGIDSASLAYDRYLADGRAASSAVYLTSDHRLWLNIISGSVAPYDGQLVWGYYVRADMSKGKLSLQFDRSPYATNIFASDGRSPTNDRSLSGWGPVRWQDHRRSGNTEEFRSVMIGISHWLMLMFFLPLPLRRCLLLCRSIRTGQLAKSNSELGISSERLATSNLNSVIQLPAV